MEIQSYLSEVYSGGNIFSLYTTSALNAVRSILTTPGASKSVKEFCVTYSYSSLKDHLKSEEVGCCFNTAIKLAKEAYHRSVKLFLDDNKEKIPKANIFGLGCTAVLSTLQHKKGDHRCYVASYNSTKITVFTLILTKDFRTREEEDVICSNLVLDMIFHSCNIKSNLPPYLFPNESIDINEFFLGIDMVGVYENKLSHVLFSYNEDSSQFLLEANIPSGTLVFPGSFNPIHSGHIELVLASLKKFYDWETSDSKPNPLVVFEISIHNFDKIDLSISDLLKRIDQISIFVKSFISNFAIAVSSAPLFLDKSIIFKNCTFLIGADTFRRLINYENSKNSSILYNQVLVDLTLIFSNNCKFIVGGRKNNLIFETYENIMKSSIGLIEFPKPLNTLFNSLDEEDFRLDISSTELRKQDKS
uniref:Cytidyltransferase-like domain-containing protein n=1 Tax=viral metagenome TaxID=1070528 RepID=A0A6C0BEE7_9ZZZZ